MAWWLLPSVGCPEEFNDAFQRVWLWTAENQAESQNGWGYPLLLLRPTSSQLILHPLPGRAQSISLNRITHYEHLFLFMFSSVEAGGWGRDLLLWVTGAWSCSDWRKGGSGGALWLQKYQGGCYKVDSEQFFSPKWEVIGEEQMASDHQALSGQGRLRLNINKNLFAQQIVKHWNRLSREVVESLLLKVVKIGVDVALGKSWWDCQCYVKSLDLALRVFSIINYSIYAVVGWGSF